MNVPVRLVVLLLLLLLVPRRLPAQLVAAAHPPIAQQSTAVKRSTTAGVRLGELIAKLRCARQVDAWLRSEQAATHAVRQPGSVPGTRAYTVPTGRIGRWLTLQIARDGELRAARGDFRGSALVRWAADCATISEAMPAPFNAAQQESGFSDTDLSARLANRGRGVIYVWSPHMPFSVDGFEAISTAAGRRELEVVPILHPDASLTFAEHSAAEARLPESALGRLASVELLFRGLTNHAPSIQLYGNGELIGPMLPGARSVEGYLEFFDSFAQALAR